MTRHALIHWEESQQSRGLFGLPVRALHPDDVIDWLISAAERGDGRSRTAAYLNAHVSNLAASDRRLHGLLRSADLLYADGMPIVWALRAVHGNHGHRASAAHFLPQFCWAAAARDLPLALVGGSPGLAERTARVLCSRVPGLRIVFTHHGYIKGRDVPRLAAQLRERGAAIVLLGLGTPRQEQLAARLRALHACRVAWCVGALFEYFGAGRRRAPAWIRDSGLEWAFRFAQEPARLAGRYTFGNARFIARAAAEILGGGR